MANQSTNRPRFLRYDMLNPADAPTRGRTVRRAPSGRSELADLLLACNFDDRTDAAFMSTLRNVVPSSDPLEQVFTMFPLMFLFQYG